MEPVPNENVVWLDEANRAERQQRRTSPVALLAECRDLLIGQLASGLQSRLDAVALELFEQADRATQADVRRHLMDGRGEFSKHSGTFLFAFRREYLACWEQSRTEGQGKAGAGTLAVTDGLSLLDDDTLERDIGVSKLAATLERHCEDALYRQNPLIGALLEQEPLDPNRNPLRPRLVADALSRALDALTMENPARVLVLAALERPVRDALIIAYKAVEERLVRARGRAAARPAARKQARKTFEPQRTAAAGDLYGTLARLVEDARTRPGGMQGLPGLPGNPLQPGLAAGAAGGVTLEALTSLLAGQGMPAGAAGQPGGMAGQGLAGAEGAAAAGAAGGVAGQGLAGGAVGSAASGNAVSAAGSAAGVSALSGVPQGGMPLAANSALLVSSLTTLQRGDLSALGPVAQLDSAAYQAGTGNILNALRQTPLVQEFTGNDAITLDIVAMLFDFIFDDEDIPELMKARIGRLQVPMVKVALLDKAFFSSRQHPARRLIDLLAEAAQGWVPDGFGEDRLLIEVDAAIAIVLDDFESDVEVFEQALLRLSSFLEQERAGEAALAEASSQVVLERERLEIAQSVAVDAVELRLEARTVPSAVVDFARGHWLDVLTQIHARDGEEAISWGQALGTLEELLWSVEPKLSAPERNQLVAKLPLLLRKLQSGMDMIALSADTRSTFFTALVACHAAAVKVGLRSGGPAPDLSGANHVDATMAAPVAPAVAVRPAGAEEVAEGIDADGESAPLLLTEIEQDGVHIGELRLEGNHTGRAGSLKPDGVAELVQEMQRGACVEFVSLKGSRKRCKLAWISPRRRIYLFTSQPGRQALSVSPDALAAALRAGEAALLSDAPLFDRAVDSLLGALNPA